MISGIKVRITSAELKKHLMARNAHHGIKRDNFEDLAERTKNEAPTTSVNNSPADDLYRRAERHSAAAEYFGFLADRVTPDETFELSEEDLCRLEFISRQYIQ